MEAVRQKRLSSEFKLLMKEPLDNVKVTLVNDNLDTWYIKIYNLTDEEYKGGEYLMEILISKDYPFNAPDFRMLTPNGRFDVNRKLCFSNSGYHPESWSPMWNMKTIIMGFVSFFLEKHSTGIGHITTSVEEKKTFAQQSIEYNKRMFSHLAFE